MSEPPHRPNLRAQQKASTRDALVEAAVAVFSRTGYSGTRIDDIARAAGASRATFYLHFRSKADLLEELVSRAGHGFGEVYEDLVAPLRQRDAAGIGRWIETALARWNDTADLMRPVYEATDANPELAQRLLPEPLPGAHQLAEALLRAGVCADEEDAATTALVFLAPLYVAFRNRTSGTPVDEGRLVGITAAIWAGYAAA